MEREHDAKTEHNSRTGKNKAASVSSVTPLPASTYFSKWNSHPPSVLRASVCVTQPIVLLPPRRFYVTLNTNAGTSWGCQLAACFCSLLSVVHLFIEKNKITASWPAGPGRPACVRFVLFFSNGWFTMMKSFLAHFTSKSYLVVGIQGFECLLRVFPLRKQLCNSCLEHILTNCFLFSPPKSLFFFLLSAKSPEGFQAMQHCRSLQ